VERRRLKCGFKEMLTEANAAIEIVSAQDSPYHLEDPHTALVDVEDTLIREE